MARNGPKPRDSGTAELSDIVHARILEFFPALTRRLGGDPERLFAKAAINAEDLGEGGSGASYRQLAQLMEVAASELRCPDFGMRLASMQRDGMFGPLGLVMKNSPTFGDALEYVSGHIYAHSLAARVWLRPWRDQKMVFAGHDILLDGIPNKSQAMEQILLLGHLGAMDITGGRARARTVFFRHHAVSPKNVYRRYFGCEVYFDQHEDGVFFSEQDLACRVVDPNEIAYRTAIAFIDTHFKSRRPPLHAETRGLIMQFLGTSHCTSEHIAAELALHPRTLHRRLVTEGTSFQQIKDEVRRDLMLYYLHETELDLTRISERLGFAEQSVLTRSCRRWFSAPPTALRSRGTLTASSA